MPKKNQVPYFHPVRRPNGEVDYYWKPTRRLRELGYANFKLPDGYKAAIAAAIERNEAVDTAIGRAADLTQASPAARLAEVITVAHCARLYEASPAFTRLKPKTHTNYRHFLRQIEQWALVDGRSIAIADLDRQMLIDLRNTLAEDPRHHRRVMMMRVLGVLLQFAEDKGFIPFHPGRNLKTPGVPKNKRRRHRVLRDHLELLTAAAVALGMPHIQTGIVLGFYTMQREADLLATTRFTTRPIDDISSSARAALAGPDGKVLGLLLEQEKTDAWVSIALAPAARAAVDSVLGHSADGAIAGAYLIPNPTGLGACPDWRFQRDFRAVMNLAVAGAEQSGARELAAFLRRTQFRDLRRSGMCWMRDLGVPIALIAAISGHSIEETQKILDTYMPRDTRAAAEGMAMAVTRQAERDAAEKEGQG